MAKTGIIARQERPYQDRNFQNAWTWMRYRFDEKDNYPIDMSADLDSGETADSVSEHERYGVTVDSLTVTSAGVITAVVSQGGEGSLKAVVTTSTGRKKAYTFQWREGYDNRTDSYRHFGRY